MTRKITQFYPEYQLFDSIQGLYLNESFPETETFVYGSFLTSLDGRIAIGDDNDSQVPDHLSSANDFRLFLELRAHADCIVTHGGYLRARTNRTLGDILHTTKPAGNDDLIHWRQQRSLPSSYFVAICSNSLQFPDPTDLDKDRTLIVTSKQSDVRRVQEWRARGYRVAIGGEHAVEGDHLVSLLEQTNCRKIFLAAGPKLLISMLATKQLKRLYLTVSQQFLGRRNFYTLTEGCEVDLSHCHFNQARLIHDTSDTLAHNQWYNRFDICYR